MPASKRSKSIGVSPLTKVLALVDSLPASKSAAFGDHTKFTVARKTFAYYLNNHHGDGIIAICCKSTFQRQQELIAQHPDRYYMPAYVGPQGWVSLRLDTPRIDWDEVFNLLVAAWRLQAPRRLAAEME